MENKKIVFKEKDIERIHPQDKRIWIKENVLQLVKTVGFKHFNMKQEGYGYIRFTYVIAHHQTYLENGRLLDSWADKDTKDDYKKRQEDFKKLMKNIDVPDDEISGPYDRDSEGKKLIGDVREHYFREQEMGEKPFAHLYQVADQRDWLIEIQYKEREDK